MTVTRRRERSMLMIRPSIRRRKRRCHALGCRRGNASGRCKQAGCKNGNPAKTKGREKDLRRTERRAIVGQTDHGATRSRKTRRDDSARNEPGDEPASECIDSRGQRSPRIPTPARTSKTCAVRFTRERGRARESEEGMLCTYSVPSAPGPSDTPILLRAPKLPPQVHARLAPRPTRSVPRRYA